jgi:RimJ/RimL family protein N-acetyltransferase
VDSSSPLDGPGKLSCIHGLSVTPRDPIARPEIEPPSPSTRTGRSVRLAAVEPRHIDFLYALAIDERVGFRWILAGQVPRREAFEQQLWSGVLAQFIVCKSDSDEPVGVAVAYNADINHGFAYVAAAMIPEAVGSGAGIEAVDLFVAYLFRCFTLRKLYFEIPEFNLRQLSTLIGALFHREGQLKDHTFYDGRYWDRFILALYREEYEQISRGAVFAGRRRRVPET